MTLGGWITFLTSLFVVISLFTWCMFKVLTSPTKDDAETIEEAFDIFDKESDKVVK